MKDLSEILRNAPEGTLLYSPMVGYVNLVGVKDDIGKRACIEVRVTKSISLVTIEFNRFGKYNPDGECMLFPSQPNRDWNYWQQSLFGPGHFVTDGNETLIMAGYATGKAYRADGSTTYIRPSRYRWATDAEKAAFKAAMDEHGRYWDDNLLEICSVPHHTEEDYQALSRRFDSLKLDCMKATAALLLTALYNVKDRETYKAVLSSIHDKGFENTWHKEHIRTGHHRKHCETV